MPATPLRLFAADLDEQAAMNRYLDTVGAEALGSLGLEVQATLGLGSPGSAAAAPVQAEPLQRSYPAQPRLDTLRGRTILVRGPTGSGKSTLAATLLSTFQGRRGWVSTSHPALWFLERSNLIQELRLDVDSPLHHFHLGPPSSDEGWSDVADLGGPLAHPTGSDRDQLLRRLREWVEWLRIREPAEEATMVVVDDWGNLVNTALGDPLGTQAPSLVRSSLARSLVHAWRSKGVSLVLLLEEGDDLRMGSSVDTLVTLGSEVISGQALRTLDVAARTPGLHERSVPYFVNRDRVVLPPVFPQRCFAWTYDAQPDPCNPSGIWPGSNDLARLFGRLPLGSLNIIEYDASVPTSALSAVSTGFCRSAAHAGGRAIVLPPPGMLEPVVRLSEMDVRASGFSELQQGIRFIDLDPGSRFCAEAQEMLIPLGETTPVNGMPALTKAMEFMAGGTPGRPRLALVSLEAFDTMMELLNTSVSQGISTLFGSSMMYGRNWTLVLLAGMGHPGLQRIPLPVERHVRLLADRGRVFARGLHPATPLFGLMAEPRGDRGEMRLVVEQGE